jgi:hypothetical protein
LGGSIVAIDLSLPDNRQLSAAGNERICSQAHAEHFAESVILVRNRPYYIFVCGGAHGRTSDESGMQAKSGQDGGEQSVGERAELHLAWATRVGFYFGHQNSLKEMKLKNGAARAGKAGGSK